MNHLLIVMLLASNADGKTLVRQQPGTMVTSPPCKTLICGYDGPAVSHVWFDGTTIRDTKGLAWSMEGTVPQVARSGSTPAGAGPYSDANYYSLAAPNPFQFAGDFWACFVFMGPTVTGSYQTLGGAGGAGAGWIATTTSTNGYGAAYFAGGVVTSTAVSVGVVNVLCLGRTGTTGYAKLNLGAIASGTGTSTLGTTMALGRSAAVTGQAFGSTVHELIGASASPGPTATADALFTSIMQQVKFKMGITAW